MKKFIFGVNNPLHSITVSNDKQDIYLSWNDGVEAIVYDPDNQLSSHATGDVIAPGVTISTAAAYSTTAAGKATWKIEFLTNSSSPFLLQTTHKLTSTGTSFGAEGYGLYAEFCYSDDTDNDKIPDYLDLDSDGDGCSDAYESGAASSSTGVSQTIAGPYGSNGFANSIETNDSDQAKFTYPATTFMAYSSSSVCADTDNDGIFDKEDIDDDNDGILDSQEYGCELSNLTLGNIKRNGITKTYRATDLTSSSNHLINDADKTYQAKTTITPVGGTISRIEYGPALVGNTNTGVSIGQQSIILNWNISASATVFDPNDQLSSHNTGDVILPGTTLVTRADYTNSIIIGQLHIVREANLTVDAGMFIKKDLTVNGTWRDKGLAKSADRILTFKFEPIAPYTALRVNFLAMEGGNGIWAFHPRSLRIDGGNAGNGIVSSIPKRAFLKEPYNVGDVLSSTDKISTAFQGIITGPTAERVYIKVAYDGIATVDKPLEISYIWNTLERDNITVENFSFQLLKATAMFGDGTCDYDRDGISDDLDSDSDNDGCPDTKEAVHGKAYATNKNYIKGPYGANGFSALMETNDTFTATYATTSWLPKVTTSPKSDYVNELVTAQCNLPFITAAGPTEFCIEGTVVLNIDLNKGATPVSYQWLKNGVAISGATNASYTATDTGDYTCTLTYSDGSSVTQYSGCYRISFAYSSCCNWIYWTNCIGTPLSLTSSYTVGNQWYYNNSLISGAVNPVLEVSNAGDYKVEYTDPISGCKSFSVTTVVVIGTIPVTPTVTLTQTSCVVSVGTITVNPTGVSTDLYSINGVDFQSSNVFTNVVPGTYLVTVKNNEGCISSAVTAVIDAQPTTPSIPTISNSGTAICSGSATVLTSSASYWQSMVQRWGRNFGATEATLSVGIPGNYSVKTTNPAGCSSTSTVTSITVAPTPTATIAQSIELSSANCGTSAPIK
ncbi:hypothetical protein GHT06_003720 [Daphnia sinensis]|uniref:Ig-like domain-containing protein n=1 Tax=Daphnia sinensis TaxID=1820382 RepID=A0AAD5KD96_9CRUS|nr:hypothetical protein GHT06_003720 [Daphnia sinensis]